MVKSKIFFLLILVLIVVTFLGINYKNSSIQDSKDGQVLNSQTSKPTEENPQVTIVAKNLDTPWSIAFLPNEDILITERNGSLKLYENHTPGNTEAILVAKIDGVFEISEGGLLGLAIHPNYIKNTMIYVYYTYSANSNQTLNRVSQFIFDGVNLGNEKIIVDKIPGAPNHNGGRIKFGPDNFLYITTGDAQEPSLAQDKKSLAGKILRVTDQGQAAPGNPFVDGKSGNPLVYSYGHRNPQGLAWEMQKQLWAPEHGPSGAPSGLDELNLIETGKNYGWPDIEGDKTKAGMESPKLNSGPDTWAPAGAAYFEGSIYFGGLRGQALYQAQVDNKTITELKTHFKNKYGRIRDVVLGPDNMLYITTSNNDGRGTPQAQDDKILKINPGKL